MVRVLVCGSREWINWGQLKREIMKLPEGTTIIHGGARGADTMAGIAADHMGFSVEVYPVTDEEWDRLGKRAGPIRNQRMLDEGKPDRVIAFQLNNSRGTRDMINRARFAGLDVQVFTS